MSDDDDDDDDDEEDRTMLWHSVFRPNLFRGKVALVTGGGSGIGRSIASELAYLGAIVVIASRDGEKCLTAAREMNDELILLLREERRRHRHRPSAIEEDDGGDGGGDVRPPYFGRVVAGPPPSIREEDQVDRLVSSAGKIHGPNETAMMSSFLSCVNFGWGLRRIIVLCGSIPQHARRILILFRFSELDIHNNHRCFRRVFNACDHKYH